jgi:tetratricopeptide (TPR) repeat protein
MSFVLSRACEVAMPLKRFLSLLALVLLFPCTVIADDAFDEGKRLFDAGEYAAAAAKFQQSFAADPENLDASFYLGRAAYETGDYETAVMAYERILIMVPEAPRVQLELARAYLRLGSNEVARQYFRLVQGTNPPEAVWQNIQEFLAGIDAAEQNHFFNGFVTIGLMYDDNVGVFPKSDTVFINGLPFRLDQKKESDTALQATMVLNHIYRINTPYAWKTSVFTYNNLYDDQSDYSLTSFGVTSGLVRKDDASLWEILGVANHVMLDQESYFTMAGLTGNYSHRLGRFMYLNLGAALQDKNYLDNDDMDATTWSASVNPVIHFGDNRISLALAREAEDARKDCYSYTRVAASLRYDRRLPYDFAAYGSFRYQATDYEDPLPLFGDERSDTQATFEAGVSKTLWRSESHRQSLAAQVSFTHTETDSNLPLYEYDKNVTLTSLTFAF